MEIPQDKLVDLMQRFPAAREWLYRPVLQEALQVAYKLGWLAGQQNERDQGPAKSFEELEQRRARRTLGGYSVHCCDGCGEEIAQSEAAVASNHGVFHERCYKADPKRGLPQPKGGQGR